VRGARVTGVDAGGRRGFALEVDERHAVARRVSALAAERRWALIELRHELPSLEQVFLRRTEGAPRAPEEAAG